MKKIILTTFALLGIYGISTASIYVLKQDGDASGYKTVEEVSS